MNGMSEVLNGGSPSAGSSSLIDIKENGFASHCHSILQRHLRLVHPGLPSVEGWTFQPGNKAAAIHSVTIKWVMKDVFSNMKKNPL